jgi:hypothetical protein
MSNRHSNKNFDPMQCGDCRSRNTATFEMIQLRQTRSGHYSGLRASNSRSHLAQATSLPAYPNFWNGAMWLGTFLAFFLVLANLIIGQIFVLKNPQLAKVSPFGIDPYYFTVKDFPPISSLIIFFGLIFFFGYFRSKSYKKEELAYKQRVKDWHNSVICLRCGHCWLFNRE